MNRVQRRFAAVWGVARIILLVIAVNAVAVTAVVGLAVVELRGADVLGTLTITLFTAVGMILASAFIATTIHLWLYHQAPAILGSAGRDSAGA